MTGTALKSRSEVGSYERTYIHRQRRSKKLACNPILIPSDQMLPCWNPLVTSQRALLYGQPAVIPPQSCRAKLLDSRHLDRTVGSGMADQQSGGAHTSRTMLFADLSSVLAQCDPASTLDQYRKAIVEYNIAGKESLSSRQRTFRYLRELYALDLEVPEFRALLRLWRRERQGRPVVAILCAASRDAALRATAKAVLQRPEGLKVTSHDLAAGVDACYPGAYSPNIRDKIGRNALSSWTQAGYLSRTGRSPAFRSHIDPSPAAVAMALVLGSRAGMSGERLFTGAIAQLLDAPVPTLHDRAHDASRKGWLQYRSLGNVTEVDVTALVAEARDSRLPITEGDGR